MGLYWEPGHMVFPLHLAPNLDCGRSGFGRQPNLLRSFYFLFFIQKDKAEPLGSNFYFIIIIIFLKKFSFFALL